MIAVLITMPIKKQNTVHRNDYALSHSVLNIFLVLDALALVIFGKSNFSTAFLNSVFYDVARFR